MADILYWIGKAELELLATYWTEKSSARKDSIRQIKLNNKKTKTPPAMNPPLRIKLTSLRTTPNAGSADNAKLRQRARINAK